MARFDLMARFYDRLNAYPNAEPLLSSLQPSASDTVLDVGGGTGQVLATLRGSAGRLIVADPSPGMHRERRGKRPWIEGVLANGERLPLRDRSVDRVVMVDALHHVPDQPSCIAEIRRVLKPEGRAVIEEFRWDRRWVRIFLGLGEKLGRFGSRFHRPEGWRKLFEAAGFEVEERVVGRRDVQFVLTPRGGASR